MADDLVKPLKLETMDEIDQFPTEMDASEDMALVKGIAFQDENTYIKKDDSSGAGDLIFKDLHNTDITLSELASSSTDEKVSVSANDINPSYLYNKITAGYKITLTEQNDGGDENIKIAIKRWQSWFGD